MAEKKEKYSDNLQGIQSVDEKEQIMVVQMVNMLDSQTVGKWATRKEAELVAMLERLEAVGQVQWRAY